MNMKTLTIHFCNESVCKVNDIKGFFTLSLFIDMIAIETPQQTKTSKARNKQGKKKKNIL